MGDPLAYLLKSFVALMDHDVMSWDDLEPPFIKQVKLINGAVWFWIIQDILTHLCLASPKRDIGEQCRPRSDAAEHSVWSG